MLETLDVRALTREPLPYTEGDVVYDGCSLRIRGDELPLKRIPIPNVWRPGRGGLKGTYHHRLAAVCPRCGKAAYLLMIGDRFVSCRRCLVRKPLKN